MDKSFQKKKESNLISQAQGGSGLMGREYLKKRMKEKQVTKIKSILKKADLLSFSYDRERQGIVIKYERQVPTNFYSSKITTSNGGIRIFLCCSDEAHQNPAWASSSRIRNLNQKKLYRFSFINASMEVYVAYGHTHLGLLDSIKIEDTPHRERERGSRFTSFSNQKGERERERESQIYYGCSDTKISGHVDQIRFSKRMNASKKSLEWVRNLHQVVDGNQLQTCKQ